MIRKVVVGAILCCFMNLTVQANLAAAKTNYQPYQEVDMGNDNSTGNTVIWALVAVGALAVVYLVVRGTRHSGPEAPAQQTRNPSSLRLGADPLGAVAELGEQGRVTTDSFAERLESAAAGGNLALLRW